MTKLQEMIKKIENQIELEFGKNISQKSKNAIVEKMLKKQLGVEL